MEVETEFVEQVLKGLKLRPNPMSLNTRTLNDAEVDQIAFAVVSAIREKTAREALDGDPQV